MGETVTIHCTIDGKKVHETVHLPVNSIWFPQVTAIIAAGAVVNLDKEGNACSCPTRIVTENSELQDILHRLQKQ